MKAKKLLSLLLVFVLAVSLVSTAFAADTGKTFSDVDSTHWAKDCIDRLVASGAADGYPDGTFKPGRHITRVEFMKLLNGVAGFTEKSADAAKFTDVKAAWKVEAVAVALAAGYTTGTTATTMSPNASITREMAVTMIGRAVVVTADSGSYALHHVVNIRRGTEIGWNDSDLDLYGQTITNLRYYFKDGTVTDYPVSITLKLKADGVSASFADANTVAVSGLPADAANGVANVKSVVGRGETPVVLAENVPVADGKIVLSDSPADGTNYQVSIVSDNYADVTVTLGYNVGK